ncbi:unnamed protein product [Caenorhabditis sp. 36 PRJEB53466]|nr:unnamed protein product [Caenorhabditis sp. 36 PRJEB53466]
MAKVSIPENAEWQTADLEIDGDFDDDMLQFLGSFEEVLPKELQNAPEKKKGKKQKKDKKVKPSEDEEKSTEERRLAKKQRRKEQMAQNRKLKKERWARRKQKESAEKEEGKEKENGEEKKKKAGEKRKNEEEGGPKEKKKKGKSTDISAWKQFFFLPPEILNAIEEMGFAEPTEIQSAVLPVAVRDRQDVLGAAETGSGKTLAFGIPLVARLLETSETPPESAETTERTRGPRALIVAPTRELVIQIMKHLSALIVHTSLKATSIVGGLAQVKQERVIAQQSPDIVVATPGRLWAMMEAAEEGSYLKEWKDLKCLVVDETDRMVEEGYFNELTHILNKVHEESDAEKLQTLVFSATLTFAKAQDVAEEEKKKNRELSSHQKIQRLIKLTGLRENKHKVIDLTRQMGTAGCLVEARINCGNLVEKDTALVYLLTRYPGRTIVFVNSVDAARRLYSILKAKQRLKNLEKFSESKNAVLLATDVAARGLDIQGIDHVIHYQVPKKVEIYIHRSGRTARASHRGLTVVLVDPPSRQFYIKLCKGLNRMQDLDIFPIDFEPLLNAIKKRVRLASEIDTLGFRCKKIKMSESWFEKAARAADLDYDETRHREMDGLNSEVDGMLQKSRQLQAQLRDELAALLPRPDGSDSLRTKYITPEIVAKLRSVGDDAIDVLHQKMEETKEWKRKSRKAARTDETNSMKKSLKNAQKNKERLVEKKKKSIAAKRVDLTENE